MILNGLNLKIWVDRRGDPNRARAAGLTVGPPLSEGLWCLHLPNAADVGTELLFADKCLVRRLYEVVSQGSKSRPTAIID